MSALSPLKMQNIDFKDLKFSNLRGKSGKRFINIFYDKKILQIFLPKLRVPFDASVSKFGALEFSLSLDNREDLISSFKKLDEQMALFAKDLNWFEDGTEFNYIPMLKQSGDYPPFIKLKISKKDGEFTTQFFDENKEEILIENENDIISVLTKNKKIISCIECAGVWFNKINNVESFGVFWKVVQLRIYPNLNNNPGNFSEYIFEDSESEIEESMFDD